LDLKTALLERCEKEHREETQDLHRQIEDMAQAVNKYELNISQLKEEAASSQGQVSCA
jgi:hypothetical protein